MSHQRVLQQVIGVTLVMLLLVGCNTPPATPVPEVPAATSTPVPSTATPVPTGPSMSQEGLVAYFPFDGDANDASGHGHHGTVHGATLTTDRHGQDGKAYAFDGVDDYISVVDSPDFDVGASDMTVLLWAFREKQVTARTVHMGLLSHTNGIKDDDGWAYTLGRQDLWVSMVKRDYICIACTVPWNAWVHLAFVKSGSQITFYLDGTARGKPVDLGLSINDSDGNLRIGMEGSTYGDKFLCGKIDDVRFYTRILTAEEILAIVGAQ